MRRARCARLIEDSCLFRDQQDVEHFGVIVRRLPNAADYIFAAAREGSRRLLELADSIEEVKNTCNFCNKKAIHNLRLLDGKATLSGAVIELGAEDKYVPTCAPCYASQTRGL